MNEAAALLRSQAAEIEALEDLLRDALGNLNEQTDMKNGEIEALRADAEKWRAYKARKDEIIAAGMGRNPMRNAGDKPPQVGLD